jgi:ribose 5-phosphate isomerase RpiB
VLVLGGRIVGIELARELMHAFLNARFSGEARHRRRLAKMTALENPLRALQFRRVVLRTNPGPST